MALAPDATHGYLGKARVEQGIGRLAEAEALIRKALSISADLPLAQFALAMLQYEAGRLDEAEALTRTLMARHGDRSDVGWLAARIAFDRGALDEAHLLLVRVLQDEGLDPHQRAETLLLAGLVLVELGRPAEAFAAAVEGKALERSLYADRASGREGETAKYARLTSWFSTADRDGWAPVPPTASPERGAETHVFLIGFPRSGTTLLEQVLAGHPNIVALEEAPTLAAPYAEFLSTDAGCKRLQNLSATDADIWRARYWAEVAGQGVDVAGGVFVDKAPAGTVYLPLIARLFPAAKILFALRDPRDVVTSCLRNAFQMNAMTYAFTDLAETAACYDACMAMAAVYRAVLPLDLIEVRHEALLDDFDTELARIASFIGFEIDPRMKDVAGTARERIVRTPSAAQVRAGLNRRGFGRWRAFSAELEPVMATLAPWVERFGYPA